MRVGGTYFGWKAFWGSNPEWLSRGRRNVTGKGTLVKQPYLRRNAGRASSFDLNPGIRLTTEEKSRKTLSQGSRKLLAGHDSISRLGRRNSRRECLCNLQHPWLALQVSQVNPRSAQISAELLY